VYLSQSVCNGSDWLLSTNLVTMLKLNPIMPSSPKDRLSSVKSY